MSGEIVLDMIEKSTVSADNVGASRAELDQARRQVVAMRQCALRDAMADSCAEEILKACTLAEILGVEFHEVQMARERAE